MAIKHKIATERHPRVIESGITIMDVLSDVSLLSNFYYGTFKGKGVS